MVTVLMATLLLLVLGMYFGQSMILDAWESLIISQSRTLPYISGTFVGRKTELNDILQLLDFDQSDTRVVSIDGPPGFGKSTLAIKVGHQMVRKGTNVLYINMLEVSTMQVLAEKVCKGADIVIRKVVKIERMFRWARDLNYNTLLILDNCDDILQTHKDDFQQVIQTLVETSPIIKVLMTSRHKATLLDDSYDRYSLHELSHHSACQLLEATVKGNKLDSDTRGVIANLTGNVPLALRVIGSLLNQPVPPRPETIIKELMQKPIQALSPEELPEHHQVFASIYLSYKHLHLYDKLCGQFLAYFPGSFDKVAALHVMQIPPNEKFSPTDYVYTALCLRELVQRSLLGYNQRTEHFEFHRLIKEFFLFISHIKGNSDDIQRTFNVNFQSHFAHRLSELSSQFSLSHKFTLGALDTEKHNIKHFLRGTIHHLELSNSVKVISALVAGLDESFLECRFSTEELYNVTKSAVNFLKRHEQILDLDASMHFKFFVKLVCHWAFFEKELEGISSGLRVLTSHEHNINDLYAKADKNFAAQYIAFYSKLSLYYENLGLHHQVPRCHEKILETTDSLKDCQPGWCNYYEIGVSYLKAGDNHQGVKYLELSIHQRFFTRDGLLRAHDLTWLHDGYTRIGATAKAEQVVDELIALLPAVLQHDVTMQNKDYFEDLIKFYLGVGKSQEAGVLLEKILQLLMELHETKDPKILQYATKLTVFLYSVKNYSKAAEIGQITIEHMKSHALERHFETARMLVLVGKSKLWTGDISGLSYLDDAIHLIKEADYTSPAAQEMLAEACIFHMWQMDINCIRIVSHFLLNVLDKDFEVSSKHLKETSPPKSTSTELVVHSRHEFSIVTVFLSQRLPIPTLLTLMQLILNQLRVHTAPNILTAFYYIGKFGVIPIVVLALICWPCLACGCMMCISVTQCCCCHCYIKYFCSSNWVDKCMLLLPLILGIYYPVVLLVYYIIFFLYSFHLYNFIVLLAIWHPVVREYLLVRCILPQTMFIVDDFEDDD